MTDLYRETIIEAAQHPKNYGPLAGADVSTQQLNPSCGDDVTVYLKLDQADHQDSAKQRVVEIGWEGHGCIISKAAMSVLSEQIIGKTRAEINQLQPAQIAEWLGLTAVAPGREKCLMVGLAAVKKALAQN